MCSSPHTCEVLGDYLNTLDRRKSRDVWGRRMMERRLRRYLWWKSKLNSADKSEKGTKPMQGTPKPANVNEAGKVQSDRNRGAFNEAIEKKEALRKEKRMNRRRVRGSTLAGSSSTRSTPVPGFTNEATPSSVPPLESGMSGKEREKLGILTGEGEMRMEANNIAELCVFYLL